MVKTETDCNFLIDDSYMIYIFVTLCDYFYGIRTAVRTNRLIDGLFSKKFFFVSILCSIYILLKDFTFVAYKNSTTKSNTHKMIVDSIRRNCHQLRVSPLLSPIACVTTVVTNCVSPTFVTNCLSPTFVTNSRLIKKFIYLFQLESRENWGKFCNVEIQLYSF